MARGSKALRYGLPFFALVFGGALGLVQFSKVRYKYRGQQPITPEEAEEMGVKMKKPGEVTIEAEYEKLKNLDIDTWENKRGPRPWEANNPTVAEIKQKLEANKQKGQSS